MIDSCDNCKWLANAVMHREARKEGLCPVLVCRLDGFQVWPGWGPCELHERRKEGKAVPEWTGSKVAQRKADNDGGGC